MQLTNTEFIQSYFSVQKTFGMQKMRSNIRDISIILGFLSETSKVWIVNYVSYKFRKLCIKLVGVWRLRMKVSHFRLHNHRKFCYHFKLNIQIRNHYQRHLILKSLKTNQKSIIIILI